MSKDGMEERKRKQDEPACGGESFGRSPEHLVACLFTPVQDEEKEEQERTRTSKGGSTGDGGRGEGKKRERSVNFVFEFGLRDDEKRGPGEGDDPCRRTG